MDAARKAVNEQIAKAQQTQANLELLQRISEHTSEPPYYVDAERGMADWVNDSHQQCVAVGVLLNNTFVHVDCVQCGLHRTVQCDLPPIEIAGIVNDMMERYKTFWAWQDKLKIVYGGTDMNGWADWCKHVQAVRNTKELFESLLERVERPGVPPPTSAVFCKEIERFIAQWSSGVFLCVGVDDVIVQFQGGEKRFVLNNDLKVRNEIADELAKHI
jgi:hypothetical protein